MATLNIKSFPEDLYDFLGQQAKKDKRSLAGEVIYLLEQAKTTITNENEKPSILQLRGLGKKRWTGIEPTKHIESERGSWE